MRTFALLLCLATATTVALAQTSSTPSSNPLSDYNRHVYSGLKNVLLTSAQKMPEENYGFKPVDSVRSYGQIVGHVADAQYLFCSIVMGEKNPSPGVEKTKTSKADLVSALKDAFAYCDKAYDGMTDAAGSQMVKFFDRDMPKLGVLEINNMHDYEHYGNLVTYLRLKGIVPPSSEQPPQQPPKK